MSKKKDRALILAAAQKWHYELGEEIIPGADTPEDRRDFLLEAARLGDAIRREQAREENKRMAKAYRRNN